jgi:thiopeptide-type bacteriocin biosynthesis protein
MIRVAAYPCDLVLPAWPDLSADQPDQWRHWLDAVWQLPWFAAAVTAAAPQLATQIGRAVSGEPIAAPPLRRLTAATARYLLRWTTRATPFGTFAGIAPVQFGARAAVRVGQAHHAVARPDGELMAEHTAQAERDLPTLRAAAVMTSSLGFPRGDRWVLPCARTDGERRWDVEIRLTGAVRTALDAARSPTPFTDLTATLAEAGDPIEAERLLADMVRIGALVSQLRPAMTVSDPARHAARLYAMPDPGARVAVDLRADVTVTLPPAVLHEAGRAAATLVAVAPPLPAWVEYHAAFIERWGPGAAVPLREVLGVLGFPAGYRGSARRAPAAYTARDRLLGQLAQQSALDGCPEVVLDDALVHRLRGDDDRPPIAHTELRFTLAADTVQDLDRGEFTLTVLSGSRHAGVAAARFLHLLTPTEFAVFQAIYRQLPTTQPGAVTVQLSGPPLDARLASVARAPELLPVLPVGEFHAAPQWKVDDLAVAGDGRRLWLMSTSTGQPVEPLLCNSILPALQQPLMRYLAEIWAAWSAPCSRFDWGHASSLPFLPRIRRGRSILHPARWIIERDALPDPSGAWPRWRDAWHQHRQLRHLPASVLIGEDDVQVRLDLDDDTHLTLLRDHLARHAHVVLTEAPGPAGWIDHRPAELLLTHTHTGPAACRPRQVRPAQPVQHRPGESGWIEARLHGRLDDILTDLAGRPTNHLPPGWWFLRYPDPQPHLRLRVPVRDPDLAAATIRRLAVWAKDPHTAGAMHDYSLHTYRPEARHGSGATLAAAHAVFAADSRAVLGRRAGDRQAITAAGMIAIADAFTGDGLGWIAAHVARRSGPRLDAAQLQLAQTSAVDEQLATALASYRSLVDEGGVDPDEVLGDLLHLHHARMIGVDDASERHCLRLARTIAHTAAARRTL